MATCGGGRAARCPVAPKQAIWAISQPLPPCYDPTMLACAFRLTDRLGRLVIKIGALGGSLAQRLPGKLPLWLRLHPHRAGAPAAAPARAERQVRSLSVLAVVLLASVVMLVLWTAPLGDGPAPAARLFSIGATPAPDSGSSMAAQPDGASGEFALQGGTIVFSMFAGAQQDLFALAAGMAEPVRLTDHPADDRDPVWSPDGQRIAFASHRDGSWDLYVLELQSGEVTRLTDGVAYEAAPSWSPDGQWLAYEAYLDSNLDVYITRADGSEGPYRLTYQLGPDYAPAWTTAPDGRQIAYVSVRQGAQDIYIISLDDPSEERAIGVTQTPDLDEESPAWGPGGTVLAYAAVENGVSLVYAQVYSGSGWDAPVVVGQGRSPSWSPDGGSLVFVANRSAGGTLLLTTRFETWETSLRAFALPAEAEAPCWSGAELPAVPRGSMAFAATAPGTVAYQESLTNEGAPYRLISLQPEGVIAEAPFLSDRVDGSFLALRSAVREAAGWDLLGQLDGMYWDLGRPVEPGQDSHSWHKAGRAFDVMQLYAEGNPAQIELVPEQVGPDTYWRLYVRCAVQDGSLGEPLRRAPWDFAARYSSDVGAYETGGRFKDIVPTGYYVDFTRLAGAFGWHPVASDGAWRYNWPSILFWHYEKRDGLDWWTAMRELYTEGELSRVFGAPPPLALPLTPAAPAVPQQGGD